MIQADPIMFALYFLRETNTVNIKGIKFGCFFWDELFEGDLPDLELMFYFRRGVTFFDLVHAIEIDKINIIEFQFW